MKRQRKIQDVQDFENDVRLEFSNNPDSAVEEQDIHRGIQLFVSLINKYIEIK